MRASQSLPCKDQRHQPQQSRCPHLKCEKGSFSHRPRLDDYFGRRVVLAAYPILPLSTAIFGLLSTGTKYPYPSVFEPASGELKELSGFAAGLAPSRKGLRMPRSAIFRRTFRLSSRLLELPGRRQSRGRCDFHGALPPTVLSSDFCIVAGLAYPLIREDPRPTQFRML